MRNIAILVCDDAEVIVSAGISAGIDMCLYLVARLHGEGTAGRTARYMEYSWDNETGGRA